MDLSQKDYVVIRPVAEERRKSGRYAGVLKERLP